MTLYDLIELGIVFAFIVGLVLAAGWAIGRSGPEPPLPPIDPPVFTTKWTGPAGSEPQWLKDLAGKKEE